jgi:prepilin signal peptidase PulO-like enzyme (type II secretory pathway)
VVVEGLTAALFVLVAWRIPVTGEGSVLAGLALMALVAALVVASFIDLELRLLPDEITLGGLAVAVPTVLLVPELLVRMEEPWIFKALARGSQALQGLSLSWPPWATHGAGALVGVCVGAAAGSVLALVVARLYFRKAFPRGGPHRLGRVVSAIIGAALGGMLAHHLLRPDWMESARALAFWRSMAGMVVGAGLVYLIGVVGTWVFRKQAMGFGDVKLMGLLGAFTGWLGVVQGFFVACFVGSVVGIYLKLRHRSQYIPFGPFLATGSLLVLLWPGAVERAFDWYTGLFR